MITPSQQKSGKESKHPLAGVILPAAGFGARMQSAIPKQFLKLAGEPILIRTVRAFALCSEIHCIVIAIGADQHQHMTTLLADYLPAQYRDKILVTTGGATRQQSVKAGLDAMPEKINVILVHDGARPLVSRELIKACLNMIMAQGAAIAAVPVNDTIKRVAPDKTIGQTIDRSNLYCAQTPQGAQRHLLEHAYQIAKEDRFIGTDEASLLEHAKIPVTIVEGEERNIKITRPGDLQIARGLFGEQKVMQRIGHGFDAHRLARGRKLILGGVTIDYPLGLLGHSDADVLTHALIDSILGALGAGDIGQHFPDSDNQYKGINSLILLKKSIGLTNDMGYEISNADLTILCQAPKLAPYLKKMRFNLAECCDVSPQAINIKATTTEKMGYTGRGEGIAAHAVVLLRTAHE